MLRGPVIGNTGLIGSSTSSQAEHAGMIRSTAVNTSGPLTGRKRRSAASGTMASCIAPLSAPNTARVNSSRPATIRVVAGPGSGRPRRIR